MKVQAWTCRTCGHVSAIKGGTNGHSTHCHGDVRGTEDAEAVEAAYRLGGPEAAVALVDQLNTERDRWPGVSAARLMWWG